MSTSSLTPYFLSKWTCPVHGKYEAKTPDPVNPLNPVLCQECLRSIQFDGQIAGHTSMALPWVSKPRIPQKIRNEPVASDNRPLRKRGRN